VRIGGLHAIEEALKTAGAAGRKPRGTLLIARRGDEADRLAQLATGRGIPVARVPMGRLDSHMPRKSHRGYLLILDSRGGETEEVPADLSLDLKGDAVTVLLLDGVTDPHNLGAILRSAEQFSADLVILPKRRSVKGTETVARTSAGASAWVHTRIVANLVRAMDALKKDGFWLYGADPRGMDLDRVELQGRIGLVMGSEGRGLRPLVKQKCDLLVRIPVSGRLDSLNVSVAAGVFLYEIQRQHRSNYRGSG
jgi:23S rRNA (guanosine2251-2'-O)-methyltransferase